MTANLRRPKLILSDSDVTKLVRICTARTESVGRVVRSMVLLAFHEDEPIISIGRRLGIDRSTVQHTIDKALQLGPIAALDDLPRSGRFRKINDDAVAWLISVACQKPKDLGYSYELWTTRLLAKHLREKCETAGRPSLKTIAPSTVCKLLAKQDTSPHKIEYYLERRDPDFDPKMAQVLHVYKEVEVYRSVGLPKHLACIISYDEKPGIQAIANTAPDLPPVPGTRPSIARDHEYVRHGTVSLLAGIDLINGHVHGIVRRRHRSAEFVEFLGTLDASYPPGAKIRIILDNHSAHISREVQSYLATKPNRFEFVFTPKHGSWLNIIETFFAKMAHSMLRGIRVASVEELVARIELYLAEINSEPVVFRWKYKLDEIDLC